MPITCDRSDKHPGCLGNLRRLACFAAVDDFRWTFPLNDTGQVSVNARACIFFDATLAMREAVCAGAGISVLPDFASADDLAAGRVIQVLPTLTPDDPHDGT